MARLPASYCLACGEMTDAATAIDPAVAKPKPNDITICLYCGHIMAFDEMLRLRNLTDKEMIMVAGDPDIIRVQQARQRIKDKR